MSAVVLVTLRGIDLILDTLVIQGSDSGFIKFGSRVDIFLPLDSKVNVQLDQKVKGGLTILAVK